MTKILVLSDFHGKFPANLKKEIKNVDMIISLGDYRGIEGQDDYYIEMFKRFKEGKGYLSPEKYFGEKKYKRLEKKAYIDMKKVLLYLNNTKKPVYTIMGNYDHSLYKFPFQKNFSEKGGTDVKWFKTLDRIESVNYKIKKINGIEFFGFGGYMDDESNLPDRKNTNLSKNQIKKLRRFDKTKEGFFSLVDKMKEKGIFVLHYPPASKFGKVANKKNPYFGNNVGIRYFTEVIKEKKPYFVLCGHMHEHQGMMKLYGVPLISVGCAHEGKGCVIDFDFDKKKLVDVKFIK
ncbi:hypothetical protein GW932_03065 [archaeon]|nr:hypothetical protein [archaeon]